MGDQEKIIPFNGNPKESPKDKLCESFKEFNESLKQEREIKAKQKKQRKPGNNGQDESINKGPAHTIFSIGNNSGNVIGSVGDNAQFYTKTTKVIKTPPPDTIGAHGHLVRTLNGVIKELADTRARDFVKQGKYPDYESAIGPVFQGINKGFRTYMQLPSWDRRQAITIIKEQPVSQFDGILNYFQEKLSGTVTGKIKGAAKKRTSGTPYYMLMNREKELLAKIGFKPDSSEVYAALERYYGVSSHKDLRTNQHKDWISYIESIVDKVEKGTLDLNDIKF